MKKKRFGSLLKMYRLHYAQIGLRVFAEKIKMKASDLCEIEHSYKDWPREMSWINNIFNHLSLLEMEDKSKLFDAFSEEFKPKKRPKGVVTFAIDSETGECVTDLKRLKKLNEEINKSDK